MLLFDVSYLRALLSQEPEIFLRGRVDLKLFQKKFQVSATSGTWVTRRLKMAISANLVHLYGWQVRFSEISCTSTMLLVLCSSVVQDVTTWSQMFLPCVDSLQDQLVTVGVGIAACQPRDIHIYVLAQPNVCICTCIYIYIF